MKVTIIRHGKVNMQWQKTYNAEKFDIACARYDASHIVPIIEKKDEKIDCPIYISQLMRTYETAEQLFGQRDFTITELLNEVPLRSFRHTIFNYPIWIWNVLGRMQWLFHNKHQLEIRKDTIKRAASMVSIVEEKNVDCILVTHGFFMRTLIKEFKRRGYCIARTGRFGISNLESIVVIR